MDASRPCCLIGEDKALLGLALEDDLEEAGIVVAGPLASCAEALPGSSMHGLAISM